MECFEADLGWRVSTVKRQLGGVPGPGRKLSVCSMLKEVMERLTGAGRKAPAAEEDHHDCKGLAVFANQQL